MGDVEVYTIEMAEAELAPYGFAEIEGLSVKDWIKKAKAFFMLVEDTLNDYEVSSASVKMTVPPSATVTISKKKK